jgi:hypothetical protein
MTNQRTFQLAFASLFAGLLCSCASVTVKDMDSGHAATPKAAPKKFYVVRFSTEHANIKEHPMRKHPGQLGAEAQDLIANYLVSELTKNIAPATLVNSPAAAGRDGWLVTGDITNLNEGSRILRMAMGLWMGRTKVETRVAVQNLPARNKAFLSFSTDGGSGATPGAATNPIPFSSAATALFQSQQGISDDSARTARMITARIADYLTSRGWPVSAKVPKPKMAAH